MSVKKMLEQQSKKDGTSSTHLSNSSTPSSPLVSTNTTNHTPVASSTTTNNSIPMATPSLPPTRAASTSSPTQPLSTTTSMSPTSPPYTSSSKTTASFPSKTNHNDNNSNNSINKKTGSVTTKQQKQSSVIIPITTLYAYSEKKLETFHILRLSANSQQEYKTVLKLGMHFCHWVLFDIPQHGYYKSPKYSEKRITSAIQAVEVSKLLLDSVLPQLIIMDYYSQILDELALLNQIATQHLESITNEFDHQLNGSAGSGAGGAIPIPDAQFLPSSYTSITSSPLSSVQPLTIQPKSRILQPIIQRNPSYIESEEDKTTTSCTTAAHVNRSRASTTSTPSLQAQRENSFFFLSSLADDNHSQYEADLQRALYLSKNMMMNDHMSFSMDHSDPTYEPNQRKNDLNAKDPYSHNRLLMHKTSTSLEDDNIMDAATTSTHPSSLKATNPATTVDIRVIISIYRKDFHEFCSLKRIQMFHLNTFQGRFRESMNGCSVIAPLLAIHYVGRTSPIEDHSILSEGIMTTNTSTTLEQDPTLLVPNIFNGEEKDDQQRQITVEKHRTFPEPNNHEEIKNLNLNSDYESISDLTINSVIDIQAPLILPEVRETLGLATDALIVPSDVHDYLIEHEFLDSDQFVGVIGGNILDDSHLELFLKSFMNIGLDGDPKTVKRGKRNIKMKAAATFFFHAHVICILRLTRRQRLDKLDTEVDVLGAQKNLDDSKKLSLSKRWHNKFRSVTNTSRDRSTSDRNKSESATDEVYFDVIDSLPKRATVLPPDNMNENGGMKTANFEGFNYDEHILNQELSDVPAVRIRCCGVESLQTILRWYACSRFSTRDLRYINSYEWDDNNADFDPRVFQAFLWTEPKLAEI